MANTQFHTRYSAILKELPKPSPNLSAPEYIPTTNMGEFDRRPVSFSNLMQWSTSWHQNRVVNTHREIGRSRPNFPTVSISATFGSRNRISARMSTDRLRNKEWVKFRAAASDFCWYIKAVSARGTDDKASV